MSLGDKVLAGAGPRDALAELVSSSLRPGKVGPGPRDEDAEEPELVARTYD